MASISAKRLSRERPRMSMVAQDAVNSSMPRPSEHRMRAGQIRALPGIALGGLRSSAYNATSRWWMASVALICAYFVAGVFGRFPWKADEPYSFGIVWEMVTRNAWLIPHVAGQPFVEKPPLVYWL